MLHRFTSLDFTLRYCSYNTAIRWVIGVCIYSWDWKLQPWETAVEEGKETPHYWRPKHVEPLNVPWKPWVKDREPPHFLEAVGRVNTCGIYLQPVQMMLFQHTFNLTLTHIMYKKRTSKTSTYTYEYDFTKHMQLVSVITCWSNT